MSDSNELMLDVILKNMQKMEDHISATKKKLHEVQEATRTDKREQISLQAKNKELEGDIARARHSLAGTSTRLSSNLLLLHHLEEELVKEEKERQQQLRKMEAESRREMEAAASWIQTLLRDHYNKLLLNNPAIPARCEAMAQELAQLKLEETRQSCEIKVLEDIDKERDRLEKRIQEEEKEAEELREKVAELKEKTAAVEMKIHQQEKRRDELQQYPSEEQEEVVGLREKLSELQQEQDYLKGALEAMRKEYKQLKDQYGLEVSLEDSTDSQQSIVDKKGARGRDEEPGQTGTEPSTKKQRTTNPPTASSSSTSSSCTSLLSTQKQANSCLDMDTDEFINEMLKDINWTSDADFSDTHTHEEHEEEKIGFNEAKKRVSTSAGPAPSTPRTFTRNPAPPTPNSKDEARPLLQHILANPSNTPPSQPQPATPARLLHTAHQQGTCVKPTPTTANTTASSFNSSLSSCLSSFSVPSSSYSLSSSFASSSSSAGLPRAPFPLTRPAPTAHPIQPNTSLPRSSHSPSRRSSHPPCPPPPRHPLPSSACGSLLNHPSRPPPPPPLFHSSLRFPHPRPEGSQQLTITSTFKQIHPSLLSSSTSNLVPSQSTHKTSVATAINLKQPWNASSSRGTSNFMPRSGVPQGTSIRGVVRPTNKGSLTTSQRERGNHFSNLASAVLPRLHQPSTASSSCSAVLPGPCAPMVRGQQKTEQQQQRSQQQQQQQQQRPQQQQQKPQQHHQKPQQHQKPWQQQQKLQEQSQKPHLQQKPQHPPQQEHRFRQWPMQKGLPSPSKRRIRFNELTEVLGTPESKSN